VGEFWLFESIKKVVIVKKQDVHKNFIAKLDTAKILIIGRFPAIEGRNLRKIMSKLAHYHYNKKGSMLLGVERDLYDLLISKGYNPFTVYRWFLLERIPDDIKFKLKQKNISQKRAVTLAFNRKREGSKDLSKSVRLSGLDIIMRL
jgi:hypothetical protein